MCPLLDQCVVVLCILCYSYWLFQREEVVVNEMEFGNVVRIFLYVQVNKYLLVLVQTANVFEGFCGVQWVLC